MSDTLLDRLTRITVKLEYDTAAARLMLACQRLSALPKYNPNWQDQPRAPQGTSEGGQWIDGGGGGAEVIYVCTRVGSVRIRDESNRLVYFVSYLCGFDNSLISWTTSKLPEPILRDPRL